MSLYIHENNHFTESIAKFYLCEMILAIEELHKNQIIYRDLKPDNILIDGQGHALLTDFGLAKENFDKESSSSFCGSLAYLSPEMIKKTGHDKAIDWYLLGVLFYEMITGFPPFYSMDHSQLIKNIETAKVRLPESVSQQAGSLIRKLMKKDPIKRLGSKNDANEIKNHSFFQGVHWDKVFNFVVFEGLFGKSLDCNGLIKRLNHLCNLLIVVLRLLFRKFI